MTLPVSLQPSFANHAGPQGMGTMHWHPHHPNMEMMAQQQLQPPGGAGATTRSLHMAGVGVPGMHPQPVAPIQSGGVASGMMGPPPGGAGQHNSMLGMNQSLRLRPTQAGGAQPYNMMHGVSPMMGPPGGGGPPGTPGFMFGSVGRSVLGVEGGPPVVFGSPGQQLMPPPAVHHVHEVARQQRQLSVYDDRPRMEMDLAITDVLLKASEDGSSVVRYEATISIASAVGKYLDAFLYVADEQSTVGGGGREGFSGGDGNKELTEASDNDNTNINDGGRVIDDYELDGLDPSSIERIRNVWKKLRQLQHRDPNPEVASIANEVVIFVHEHLLQRRVERFGGGKDQSHGLSGIEEESHGAVYYDSDHAPESSAPGGSNGRSNQMAQVDTKSLRRVASELATPVGEGLPETPSMERDAGIAAKTPQTRADRSESQSNKLEYCLPTSKFYDWKKSIFMEMMDSQQEVHHSELDPLSPLGATHAYQERRNFLRMEAGQKLASHYVNLAPKPPKPSKQSIEEIMIPDETADEDASNAILKRELELKESKLLRNTGVQMTSMIKFHAYEDILVACGSEHGVSVWDTEKGTRAVSFINGNPKGSRMTTAMWLNEASTSLFLVGCDDGSARIWDDIVENNGEASRKPPNLVSAFFAAPDMVAGARGKSGLVCEWQQYSGTLVAGGNSRYLRCWNLEAEKCGTVLETDSDACITTLASAWDSESLGTTEPKGSPGFGPHILVGGHSDGSLKVFDIRSNRVALEAQSGAKSWTKRRRPTKFTEHSSWIVNTTFTGYGARYEVVSGSVAGDIKAWDLRMSSSLRTLEVQRSTMTALAVHRKIPVVATGSHAQFIKILTLDGETLKVIRYHEEMSNRRIGPVSCLEFHPFKPLLAAGATDSLVSIYAPKLPLSSK
jgi:regulator-associated protein of mTOR